MPPCDSGNKNVKIGPSCNIEENNNKIFSLISAVTYRKKASGRAPFLIKGQVSHHKYCSYIHLTLYPG